MVEDGTVPDNSKEVIGENVPLSNCDNDSGIATGNPKNKDEDSINCDWDPCNFKSKQRSVLIKHIDLHIGLKNDHQEVIQIDDSTEIDTTYHEEKEEVMNKKNEEIKDMSESVGDKTFQTRRNP